MDTKSEELVARLVTGPDEASRYLTRLAEVPQWVARYRELERRRAGHKARLRNEIKARKRHAAFHFTDFHRRKIAKTFPKKVPTAQIDAFLDQTEDLIRWYKGEELLEPYRRTLFELLPRTYSAIAISEKHLGGAEEKNKTAAATLLKFLEKLPEEAKTVIQPDIVAVKGLVIAMNRSRQRGPKLSNERLRSRTYLFNLMSIYQQAAGKDSRGRSAVLGKVAVGSPSGMPKVNQDALKKARQLGKRFGVERIVVGLY